jgi:hypothetical protein
VRRVSTVIAAISILAGTVAAADTQRSSYARIAVLRPHDGDTVDFEAGYVRHLDWHRQAGDKWTWYGWNITYGDRQRWFVYASFGHQPADFDNPVSAAEDERDNILNVTPHAEFVGNALFEFRPELSRGSGVPEPTARLELTSVELVSGAAEVFEKTLRATQSALTRETLWYRMVAGGPAPRYVRLRPHASLATLIDASAEQSLPEEAHRLIAETTVEILTLRPTMSYGLTPVRP